MAAKPLPDDATLRQWIVEMKEAPRGPFQRIRWFCEDGSVLPPKAGCSAHGGGIQHGEWNERTVALRDGGIYVGNVLAELEPGDFTGPDADLNQLRQILIERFLIGWDDGWIFRGARSYRGGFQAEDEEAGARAVVMAMLADPLWRAPARFTLLRESVRLLPVRTNTSLADEVRLQALKIADDDPAFMPIRAKIHGSPDPSDAARVRTHASERGKAKLADSYEQLASRIDELYGSDVAESIEMLADSISDASLAKTLREASDKLEKTKIPGQRLATLSKLLVDVRERFPRITSPEAALAAIDASLAIEGEIFAAGNQLAEEVAGFSRQQRLWMLEYTSQALYGAGFLSKRHIDGVTQAIVRLEKANPLRVDDYRREVAFLARLPEWCNRWLAFTFADTVEHLAPLEPEVHLFPQDRLRGSPVLFYSATLDTLSLDVDKLAGISHELFGKPVGAGLRALNPGIAEGPLYADGSADPEQIASDGIYLLPETVAELPRVAGILTEGEGSSLSHVQLLARNLGIPNVVVGRPLLPQVRQRSGARVVMAVSPGGVVRLGESGPKWDAVLGKEELTDNLVIRPDLDKLDLGSTDFISLSSLRAADSGAVSGPKGANLGELKFNFGDAVPGGFVIPFGAFRQLLDRQLEPGGPKVFDWMVQRYDAIEAASPSERPELVSAFLTRLRDWIATVELPPAFVAGLRTKLEQTFGPDGSYGVFVRSDTNVEDLPGFTGAGLNLTVPNVIGSDNVIASVREVWASPFTERAYGWRQSNMEQPEFVFPAVVVQLAVPSEKSGVMVTADVDTGDMGYITVAVNEGVGGAVEGQATESLLIDLGSGSARFLAQATAHDRAELSPQGGVRHVPATGTDAVLRPPEIAKLVEFARSVPARLPSIRTEEGKPAPADVEFAFLRGKLILLQVRPFVESKRARTGSYLRSMDAGLRERGSRIVDLSGVPGQIAWEGNRR